VRRGAPRSVNRLVGENPIRLISYSAGSDGDGCSRKAQVEALRCYLYYEIIDRRDFTEYYSSAVLFKS